MRFLLDTCAFLWMVSSPKHLSERAREEIKNPDNQIFLSSASSWEIAIKYETKKLKLPENPALLIPRLRQKYRVDSLPIEEAASLHTTKLPPLHNDPFDRILIAQALTENLVLLTPDEMIVKYPVQVLW